MIVTESSPHRPPPSAKAMLLPALATALGLTLLAAAAVPGRDRLYLTVADLIDTTGTGTLAGFVADKGLFVLVGLTGVLALRLLVRDQRGFGVLTVAGVGVVVAHLTSELIKLVVTEPRPCRALDISTALECPEIGDWSWPSNHSVIAASFATACILAAPRIIWAVAPLAVILGFSRVTAGVHYVHDVLSGMALGVLVVSVVTVALLPVARHITTRIEQLGAAESTPQQPNTPAPPQPRR